MLQIQDAAFHFVNALYLIRTSKSTLMFQKPRMSQVHGVKGKAVVNYCEPLATKEMGEYLGTRATRSVECWGHFACGHVWLHTTRHGGWSEAI